MHTTKTEEQLTQEWAEYLAEHGFEDTIGAECAVCYMDFGSLMDGPVVIPPCKHVLCPSCSKCYMQHECTKIHACRHGGCCATVGCGRVLSWDLT